jgi:hypothetical protein
MSLGQEKKMKSIKLVAAFVLSVVLLNTGYTRAESESAGVTAVLSCSTRVIPAQKANQPV